MSTTSSSDKGSKIVFSTRNRDLIPKMKAEESLQLQPLSTEESWDLFCKVAFQGQNVPRDIENIARKVANECEGLPLAITVIGSTMISNSSVNEWKLALNQLKNVDRNFQITHPDIDQELYRRLRWSYDQLPDANLKNCFLYCAMFEEDAEIPVEKLVQMWIGEGLLKTREDGDYDYLLEIGNSYVKLLEKKTVPYSS